MTEKRLGNDPESNSVQDHMCRRKRIGLLRIGTVCRKLIHPLVRLLALNSVPYRVVQENKPIYLPKRPVIFAANHSAYPDVPILCSSTPMHCVALAGKQKLDVSGKLFFFLNGTVIVDRGNKEDMAGAKEKIIAHLNRGENIVWFPEGIWNISDSLPMLPMKWGVIDVAARSGAQIVPVAIRYDREQMKCYIRWGTALDGIDFANKAEAIGLLRDQIASMRWMDWEKTGVSHRSELDLIQLQSERDKPFEEYKILLMEDEKRFMFRPVAEPKEVYEAVWKITPRLENAFLFQHSFLDSKMYSE